MGDPLRLKAVDRDDLRGISACLQDAVLRLGDMSYDVEAERFVLVANRFCWECDGKEDPSSTHQRVHCGLYFDHVKRVQKKNLEKASVDRFLVFLAVEMDGNMITIYFSGGGTIRLEVERLLCHLRDLDEPWPTSWRPRHDVD